MKTNINDEMTKLNGETEIKMPELPARQVPPKIQEAPHTLTAPVPVGRKPEIKGADEFETKVKNFGILLGAYFTRKSAGANITELKAILSQILKRYTDSGIDLSIVTDEWNELLEREQREMDRSEAKEKERKALKTIESQMKPDPIDEEEMGSMDPNFERSWNFYLEAVKRGISDRERIELLESIKIRHGEAIEGRIQKELDIIRRRVK